MVNQELTYEFSSDGGLLCLDFTNTVDFYGDGGPVVEHDIHALTSYDALLAFAEQAGTVNASQAAALRDRAAQGPAGAAAILARALSLREAIFRAVLARIQGAGPDRPHLDCLNGEYVDAMRHRRLVWGDDGPAAEWVEMGENLASPLWPIAESAVELLLGGDVDLVRRCGGEDCDWLFVDRTKNHSRRWCRMSGCGNRAKAKRHYEKRRRSNRES
ncbi:MAG: hypothetical protein C0506_11365 [Anaerolinea sp.]|nr:hypothetical protein [Anaerolinea sp.]